MPEPLYRLVYISRNQIVGDDQTVHQQIEQILQKAREKNPLANITGALMFNAGCFAQILEGSHDEIQATFERIQCDPKHSQVIVLSFEPTEQRLFANWSMAYQGNNSVASSKFAGLMQASDFDSTRLDGEEIFDLLKQHLIEAE